MTVLTRSCWLQELAEEFGRHRAKEFNVGVERKDTGVRYEDVAGIDSIKADIEEVMKMILGNKEYQAMGARAPRVRYIQSLILVHPSLPIAVNAESPYTWSTSWLDHDEDETKQM